MRLPLEVEENTRQRARSIEIAPYTARESKLLQQLPFRQSEARTGPDAWFR